MLEVKQLLSRRKIFEKPITLEILEDFDGTLPTEMHIYVSMRIYMNCTYTVYISCMYRSGRYIYI